MGLSATQSNLSSGVLVLAGSTSQFSPAVSVNASGTLAVSSSSTLTLSGGLSVAGSGGTASGWASSVCRAPHGRWARANGSLSVSGSVQLSSCALSTLVNVTLGSVALLGAVAWTHYGSLVLFRSAIGNLSASVSNCTNVLKLASGASASTLGSTHNWWSHR